jgi:hypothetical protein
MYADAGNRYISARILGMRRADMSDLNEELADFAAMSEDDGFLGQCAGTEVDLPATATRVFTSGECGIARMRQRPQQLQLLVVLERSSRSFSPFFQSPS